ncbi:MAG: ABC transporter ATP-binding protein [Alkalispirochaeta sp.]
MNSTITSTSHSPKEDHKPMESAHLTISDLVKVFRDGSGSETRAVDGISLDIEKGEFVTLLGPSGCGKTTTLRMIAGFEQPTGGEIRVKGKSINPVPPFERNMPMVFQSYALFPHLTIFDNIAYGLKLRKASREVIRNEVAVASQMVNLVGLEKRYPGELSGGQQQRVALARALVLKPEIILFDEPLSNLDAKLRIQTRTEIKRVQHMLGITAIYVTHDQAEALSMSDKIVVMNNGKIMQVGSPEQVYNHPADPFVADFIGNANFLESQVTAVNDTGVTVTIGGKNFVIDRGRVYPEVCVGDEVYVTVKPEAMEISQDPGDLTGRVDVNSFVGAVTEYKVEFDGQFITVIHSNTGETVTLHHMDDEVSIHLNPEYCRVYKR